MKKVKLSDSVTIIQGNCLKTLKTIPEKSVNCCVTSPPYWGLRDYNTDTWKGGDPNCNHIKGAETKQNKQNVGSVQSLSHLCMKCGAQRVSIQIGLERSPQEYVTNLVNVFRLVRKALRDDGTLWLNLGDSYASNRKGTGGPSVKQLSNVRSRFAQGALVCDVNSKNLVGIPWRVAFALQADGWCLRSDIIWSKPNPMPESVIDRPTKSHEYIFLLAKSTKYFYDSDAIAEKATHPHEAIYDNGKNGHCGGVSHAGQGSSTRKFKANPNLKNKRSVWTETVKPFLGVHFATYPTSLIKPCILAGCPEGGVVLDPFNGAGTTGLVSIHNNRRYIGLELNGDYVEITKRRLEKALARDWRSPVAKGLAVAKRIGFGI